MYIDLTLNIKTNVCIDASRPKSVIIRKAHVDEKMCFDKNLRCYTLSYIKEIKSECISTNLVSTISEIPFFQKS